MFMQVSNPKVKCHLIVFLLQLFKHCSVRKLFQGESLYKKEDPATNFYFLLRGQLHCISFEGSATICEIINEWMFFGFHKDPHKLRNEFTTSKAIMTEVIQIDILKFQEVTQQAL